MANLPEKTSILVVTPFPDGILEVAGTIAKHARLGHEIHVFCLAHYPERRKRIEEMKEAASVLGVKECIVSDFVPHDFYDDFKTRKAILDAILAKKPDVVLSFWYDNEGHPDVRACLSVIDACFMAQTGSYSKGTHHVKYLFMFEGEGGFTKNFEPDFYIDITDVMEIKKKAIMMYQSTAIVYGGLEQMVDHMLVTSRWKGLKAHVKYAESFKRIIYPTNQNVALEYLPIDRSSHQSGDHTRGSY